MVNPDVMLAALKKLQQEGPRTKRDGICANISNRCIPESHLSLTEAGLGVAEAAESWDEFAGDRVFPVEGSVYQYCRHVNKWDDHTQYGAARKRLLAHLIKYYEEKVNG